MIQIFFSPLVAHGQSNESAPGQSPHALHYNSRLDDIIIDDVNAG